MNGQCNAMQNDINTYTVSATVDNSPPAPGPAMASPLTRPGMAVNVTSYFRLTHTQIGLKFKSMKCEHEYCKASLFLKLDLLKTFNI